MDANPASSGPADGVEVRCACKRDFRVAKSLRNGIVNCPWCGKAVEVPGGPELLFGILLGLGVLAVLTPTVILCASGEIAAGLIVLVLGGGLLAGLVAMA